MGRSSRVSEVSKSVTWEKIWRSRIKNNTAQDRLLIFTFRETVAYVYSWKRSARSRVYENKRRKRREIWKEEEEERSLWVSPAPNSSILASKSQEKRRNNKQRLAGIVFFGEKERMQCNVRSLSCGVRNRAERSGRCCQVWVLSRHCRETKAAPNLATPGLREYWIPAVCDDALLPSPFPPCTQKEGNRKKPHQSTTPHSFFLLPTPICVAAGSELGRPNEEPFLWLPPSVRVASLLTKLRRKRKIAPFEHA